MLKVATTPRKMPWLYSLPGLMHTVLPILQSPRDFVNMTVKANQRLVFLDSIQYRCAAHIGLHDDAPLPSQLS